MATNINIQTVTLPYRTGMGVLRALAAAKADNYSYKFEEVSTKGGRAKEMVVITFVS